MDGALKRKLKLKNGQEEQTKGSDQRIFCRQISVLDIRVCGAAIRAIWWLFCTVQMAYGSNGARIIAWSLDERS
jgi:hypothetical protein